MMFWPTCTHFGYVLDDKYGSMYCWARDLWYLCKLAYCVGDNILDYVMLCK